MIRRLRIQPQHLLLWLFFPVLLLMVELSLEAVYRLPLTGGPDIGDGTWYAAFIRALTTVNLVYTYIPEFMIALVMIGYLLVLPAAAAAVYAAETGRAVPLTRLGYTYGALLPAAAAAAVFFSLIVLLTQTAGPFIWMPLLLIGLLAGVRTAFPFYLHLHRGEGPAFITAWKETAGTPVKTVMVPFLALLFLYVTAAAIEAAAASLFGYSILLTFVERVVMLFSFYLLVRLYIASARAVPLRGDMV
ncbi:hypothetical protein [Alkalicoccus chagannorensis]|uniref:hypothetical protein n=1 Tax=Alkalicoccus chagannorensis TaxID=427072 RepID=UPI0003FC7267|nr:hypothetical protein [Alkalicoccus chagannorensis]